MTAMNNEQTRQQKVAYLSTRLARAIHRDTVAILGPEGVRALARDGNLGLTGEPPSGPWAVVHLPSIRFDELSVQYIRGECDWDTLVAAGSALLEAWKQAAHSFAEQRSLQRSAPRPEASRQL